MAGRLTERPSFDILLFSYGKILNNVSQLYGCLLTREPCQDTNECLSATGAKLKVSRTEVIGRQL